MKGRLLRKRSEGEERDDGRAHAVDYDKARRRQACGAAAEKVPITCVSCSAQYKQNPSFLFPSLLFLFINSCYPVSFQSGSDSKTRSLNNARCCRALCVSAIHSMLLGRCNPRANCWVLDRPSLIPRKRSIEERADVVLWEGIFLLVDPSFGETSFSQLISSNLFYASHVGTEQHDHHLHLVSAQDYSASNRSWLSVTMTPPMKHKAPPTWSKAGS